jgi:hypothetical protein
MISSSSMMRTDPLRAMVCAYCVTYASRGPERFGGCGWKSQRESSAVANTALAVDRAMMLADDPVR